MGQYRNIYAARNRGKSEQIIAQNFMTYLNKSAKANAKKREREKRAQDRENERARRAEQRRLEAERVRKEKEERKLNEKMEKFYNRLKEDFRKKQLILTDTVASDIINRAIAADMKITELRKYYIDGKEEQIRENSSNSILEELVTNKLIISELDFYCDKEDFNSLVRYLTEKRYQEVSEVEQDTKISDYLDKVGKKEIHLKSRRRENKKVVAFMKKVKNQLTMLPEDFDALMQFVRDDEGMTLTVDKIVGSEPYIEGQARKKVYKENVETKIKAILEMG